MIEITFTRLSDSLNCTIILEAMTIVHFGTSDYQMMTHMTSSIKDSIM